jgi:hypothetical protein
MTETRVNWLLGVFLLVVPLAFAIWVAIKTLRHRQRGVRIALGVAMAIVSPPLFAIFMALAGYGWAIHLETKWSPKKPKTQAQLESYLSLYSKYDIQPTNSLWGHNHTLKPGERMTQYLLLWMMPLDVVYSSNQEISVIYTSYE